VLVGTGVIVISVGVGGEMGVDCGTHPTIIPIRNKINGILNIWWLNIIHLSALAMKAKESDD